MGDILSQFLLNFAIGGVEGATQQIIADALGNFESRFLSKLGVKLGAEDFAPLGSISYWNRITKSIMDTNQSLGIAGNLGLNIQKSFRASLMDAANIGATYEDIAKEYKTFITELGRSRQLTSAELVDLVEFNKLFGESAAQIFSVYSELGVNFSQTSNDIQQIGIDSNKLGLNYAKVTKTLMNNLNVINRLSFAKGRRGMQEMAKLAVQTRISMESASSFADKIFDEGIEGAIEMSANLQVLGGQMATLGDPFELMYMARNAPEELQKRVGDLTKEVAAFNRETGEISINALGMSRLREFSKATGISLEELAQSARLARRETEIQSKFDFSIRGANDFDEILTKVAGVSEFDSNLNDWVVKIGEETKKIGELTPEMIGQLDFVGTEVVADVNERLIKSNESLNETMQRFIDQFKLGMMEGVQENFDQMYTVTRDLADSLKVSMESGGLKTVIDFMSNLSRASFDNFLELYQTFASGDIMGAGNIIIDRLGEGIVEIGRIFMRATQFLAEAIWGAVQWGANRIFRGIGGAMNDIGNILTAPIRRTFGVDELNFVPVPRERTFEEVLPDIDDFMGDLLPEQIRSQIPNGTNGNTNQNQQNIQPQQNMPQINQGDLLDNPSQNIQDLLNRIGSMNNNFGTGIGGNINGSTSSTDLNININVDGNMLTPSEMNELSQQFGRITEDFLRSKNSKGGKLTSPTQIG